MLSPFSVLQKENSKFKSLDVWNQLKKRGDDLSWYFAVSTNCMPAKYLISKSIFCNIPDLAATTEERLWEEHENLTEIFLETWKEVRSEKHDVIRTYGFEYRAYQADAETLQFLSLELSN